MTISVTDRPISLAPEWAPQKAIWTAWPANPAAWYGDLEAPRRDVAAMVRALADGNRVRLLVNGAEAEASARAALGGAADFVPARYGDIWLRDTGPIFARRDDGPVALRFKTNGWGGKFDLPDDATVGDDIARIAGWPILSFDFVLEGGAVDHDGEGTMLATCQTLLNANRNGWSKAEAEAALHRAFGAKTVIWIDEGLKNDHTDGHIDNVVRFVGPARVVCQSPAGADDPNAETLEAIARSARKGDRRERPQARGDPHSRRRPLSQRAWRNVAGLASQFRHRQWRRGDAALWNADRGRRARCTASGVPGPQGRRRAVARIARRWRRRRRLVPLHHAAGACVMTSRTITVAAIQSSFGPDMAANIAKIEGFVREAAKRGAQVVLPPELFQSIYFPTRQDPKWFEMAKPASEHPSVRALQKLAKELKLVIPISFFEKDGPRYYNSVAIADADGEILGVYRKSHIPDGPGYQEKYYFRPGDTGFQAWKTKSRHDRRRHLLGPMVPGGGARHGAEGRRDSCSTRRPSARSPTIFPSTRMRAGSARCRAMPCRMPCRWSPRTASAWSRTTARRRAITATPSSPTMPASWWRASATRKRAC